MRGIPLLSLLLATAVLFGAAALVAPRGDEQLLAWDEGSAGLSQARQMLEVTPRINEVSSLVASPLALSELSDASRTLLIAAGAERAYTRAETSELLAFQRDGGALLILDKNPATSALAGEYGIQVDGREIISPRSDGSFLPLQVTFPAEANRTLNVRLFRPTSLGQVPDWQGGVHEVLGATDPDAVIDVDQDGRITPTADVAGTFPLIVLVRPTEGGLVAFVADPIAFTNALLSDAQNRALFSALVGELLPDGGDVVFDESRHAQPAGFGPEAMRLVLLLLAGWRGLVIAALLLLAAGFVAHTHKGLAPYGHLFEPETVVPVPQDAAELATLLASRPDEGPP